MENDVSSKAKLWSNINYRWWLLADTTSQISSSVVSFSIPLLIIMATGSEGLSTTISSIYVIIMTLTGIIGGVIQDRYERRFLMKLNGLISFFILLVTGIITFFYGLSAYVVIVASFFIALRKGILGNTSNVILRSVVGDENLAFANSANLARDSSVNIISGPIGGFLLGISNYISFFVGSFLSLFSFFSTSGIKNYWKPDDQKTEKAKFRTAFKGFWWIISNNFQRRIILTAAIATGAGNSFLLLTMFEILKNTSNNVTAGFVNSVAAGGMFLGSFLAAWLVNRVRSGLLVILMFVNLTVGLTISAIVPILTVKLIFIPISLFLLPAGSAVLSSFFSIIVSQENLGRIGAGSDLVTYFTLSALTFVTGWIMQAFSYVVASAFIAAILLVSAVSALSIKALRTLPEPSKWEEHIEKYNINTL